jgi:hypothetical protein
LYVRERERKWGKGSQAQRAPIQRDDGSSIHATSGPQQQCAMLTIGHAADYRL